MRYTHISIMPIGNRLALTFCSIRMWCRIELVLLVCQPESTVSVEDFLAEIGQELLEDASAVDARSAPRLSIAHIYELEGRQTHSSLPN